MKWIAILLFLNSEGEVIINYHGLPTLEACVEAGTQYRQAVGKDGVFIHSQCLAVPDVRKKEETPTKKPLNPTI